MNMGAHIRDFSELANDVAIAVDELLLQVETQLPTRVCRVDQAAVIEQ